MYYSTNPQPLQDGNPGNKQKKQRGPAGRGHDPAANLGAAPLTRPGFTGAALSSPIWAPKKTRPPEGEDFLTAPFSNPIHIPAGCVLALRDSPTAALSSPAPFWECERWDSLKYCASPVFELVMPDSPPDCLIQSFESHLEVKKARAARWAALAFLVQLSNPNPNRKPPMVRLLLHLQRQLFSCRP